MWQLLAIKPLWWCLTKGSWWPRLLFDHWVLHKLLVNAEYFDMQPSQEQYSANSFFAVFYSVVNYEKLSFTMESKELIYEEFICYYVQSNNRVRPWEHAWVESKDKYSKPNSTLALSFITLKMWSFPPSSFPPLLIMLSKLFLCLVVHTDVSNCSVKWNTQRANFGADSLMNTSTIFSSCLHLFWTLTLILYVRPIVILHLISLRNVHKLK